MTTTDERLFSAKLTGTPGEDGWSCIYDYTPEKQDYISSHGHLYVVLSLERMANVLKEVDFATLGRNIFQEVVNAYYSAPKEERLSAIKDAARKYIGVYKNSVVVEVSILVHVEQALYMSIVNGATVYIYRDGSLSILSDSREGEEKSLSGNLKEGDVFLVSTSYLKDNIAFGVLKPILALKDPQAVIQALTPKLYENDSDSLLAAVSLHVPSRSDTPVDDISVDGISPSAPVFYPTRSGGVRPRVVMLIDRILSKLPNKQIRVQGDTVTLDIKRRKKTASFVGVVLLVILGLSILLGARTRQEKAIKDAYLPVLTQAKSDLAEARSLSGLNTPKARELLLNARNSTNELKASGVLDPELDSLISDIAGALGEVAGVYEDNAKNFLDLSLISSGFEGSDIDISENTLRVLDSNGRRLVSIDGSTKNTEVIAGPDYLPDSIATFAYTDRSFILSTDGIREVTGDVELVVKPEWNPNNILVHAFAGNIYVLNREENRIIRYSGVRGGFLDGEDWLADGISVDFSDAVSWSIDGTVWVAYPNALRRFSLGVPTNIAIQGLVGQIGDIKDIYTSEEEDNVYILDPQNSRVIAIDKDGLFQAEYVAPELVSARKIVASEALGKLFFLSDKLYYIELK